MAGLQYHAVHVREMLTLSRTELQRWLSALPPFSLAPTQARAARSFTIADLAFLSMVAVLQKRLEIPIRTIASFSAALHAYVDASVGPAGAAGRVFLNQSDDGSWQVGHETGGILSLSIDLMPIWQSVYEFVGIGSVVQPHLPFGLMSVPPPPAMEPSRAHRAR